MPTTLFPQTLATRLSIRLEIFVAQTAPLTARTRSLVMMVTMTTMIISSSLCVGEISGARRLVTRLGRRRAAFRRQESIDERVERVFIERRCCLFSRRQDTARRVRGGVFFIAQPLETRRG